MIFCAEKQKLQCTQILQFSSKTSPVRKHHYRGILWRIVARRTRDSRKIPLKTSSYTVFVRINVEN